MNFTGYQRYTIIGIGAFVIYGWYRIFAVGYFTTINEPNYSYVGKDIFITNPNTSESNDLTTFQSTSTYEYSTPVATTNDLKTTADHQTTTAGTSMKTTDIFTTDDTTTIDTSTVDGNYTANTAAATKSVLFKKQNIKPTDASKIIDASTTNYKIHVKNTTKALEENIPSHGNLSKRHNSSNHVFSDHEIAKRFSLRYQRMYKNCHRATPRSPYFLPNSNILVNEKHKLEVCVVPKAGSTSWHHLIWKLRMLDANRPYFDKLYTPADTIYNHKTSKLLKNRTAFSQWQLGTDDDFFTEPNPQKIYRVMLGRHPFARLISAWNQKMLTSAKIYERWFKWYPQMEKYRKYPPDAEHVMSWQDFATYVSDIRIHSWKMDYHFIPAAQLCRQCDYFYTYIVKLETINEDHQWLERRLNIPKELELVKLGSTPIGSKVNDDPTRSIKKYMKLLPVDVVHRLYALYATDFELFGYTYDIFTSEAGGFE